MHPGMPRVIVAQDRLSHSVTALLAFQMLLAIVSGGCGKKRPDYENIATQLIADNDLLGKHGVSQLQELRGSAENSLMGRLLNEDFQIWREHEGPPIEEVVAKYGPPQEKGTTPEDMEDVYWYGSIGLGFGEDGNITKLGYRKIGESGEGSEAIEQDTD